MNIKQQQNPLPFLSGLVNTTTITTSTSTNLISGVEGGGGVEPFPQIIPSSLAIDSSFSSSSGSESPSLSLQTGIVDDSLSTIENQRIMQITSGTDTASTFGINDSPINLQIFIPELQMQKCLSVPLDEFIWDIKQRLFESLPQQLNQSFNYGLFLPPCDGRAGKFLLDDRPLRDYPFHDCAPYVELKYKKRVYKMLRLDEKTLRSVHSKNNLRKFSEAIQQKNIQKLDRLCQQGLDPNFHDSHGETPLTLASGIPDSRQVIVQLVGGGAHLDFRNTEGQTGMHKAAFLSVADNVRVMLELGASPNYKDLIGLTPLYYNMLNTESNPEVTEMLLAEAADLDIVDMHGNTALHQSCKNGLCKHTEQLIYYGANIDSKNINGNTPLHVCAVNGRVECAQLLLYRGANPSLINSNGQTAVQVAQIVGNMAVANVILGHSPQSVVPFLEPPRLNTRRRLSTRTISQDGSILRRRSLSHCSSSSSTIASNHLNRLSSNSNQINEQQKIRQNPSVISTSTSEYGTLRKIPPNSVQHQQPGFEPNTPRILVIPRGPKGFGFILRGARYADSMQLDFRPTLTIPALQFFEGVDMQGMAMRAGLRPGDFLLEINGVDVRSASHEQVVELIHQCGDTITLKVVTVDVDLLAKEQQLQNTQHLQQQIYASSTANYATVGRRNHSVPRLTNNTTTSSSTPPPPLPQRDPSTTLSFGKHSSSQFTAAVDVHNINNNYSSTSSNNNNNSCDIPSSPSISQQLTFIPIDNQHKQQQQQTTRCASVKLTKSVRRISAAELEHLMVQQGSSNNNNNNEQIDIIQNIGIPKKFTSVSEMKRRKQQQQSSNNVRSIDLNNNNSLIKNSISTPDLQSTEENIIYSEGQGIRSNKIILRPKTPPPPPPQSLWKNSLELGEEEEEENNEIICCQNSSSSIPIYASTVVIQSNQNISKGNGGGPPPPPPPPPPPINLLQRNSQPSTSSSIQKQLPNKKQSETINSSNCVDISAETLRSVRLRPVQQQKHLINNNNNNKKEINNNKILSSPPKDFNSDLRSALARRRSKVKIIEETSKSSGSGNEEINTKIVNISINKEEGKEKGNKIKQQQINNNGGGILTNNNRYNRGLSLRESVLENVSGVATKCGQNNEKIITNSSHSPPGGFIGTKKDSGYTSSRTSLEPSECGDCENNGGNNNSGGIIITTTNNNNIIYNNSLPVKHRVNVLSQQLIDQQANNNNNNTSTNLLNKNFCLERDNVETFLRIPPVDYDQSENSSINSNNQQEEENNETNYSFNSNKEEEQKKIELIQKTGEFKQKPIKEWNYLDICEWLLFLELSEYCSSFSKIKGSDLLYFDRSRYTALGVTRIAHRQKMEQSIKDFNKNE